jgi:hypothetical protein
LYPADYTLMAKSLPPKKKKKNSRQTLSHI